MAKNCYPIKDFGVRLFYKHTSNVRHITCHSRGNVNITLSSTNLFRMGNDFVLKHSGVSINFSPIIGTSHRVSQHSRQYPAQVARRLIRL